MFAQDYIDRVRDANNIVDIISEVTELKKSGSGMVGLCPFPTHREKTPSFSVSDLKQAYYCFGCQKHGNIFTFLKEMKGMSFPESVEFLAERAHIPLPEKTGFQTQKQDLSKKLYAINHKTAQFFYKNLQNLSSESEVRKYAEQRGLGSDIVEKFHIGYATREWDDLQRHLRSEGFQQSDMESLGLIKKRQDGSGYYDLFRDRLIFPILSTTGHFLGFGGRVLDQSLPKYLNSSESPVFSKSRVLYGLHETGKYIRSEDQIIIVEGYMDFLALYRAGIQNVAATLGTALTEEHARLIKRFTKNVVLLFDGDEAGQKATMRSLSVLLKEGLYSKSFELPERMDPDDFLNNHGAEPLRQMIKGAEDLVLRYVDRLLKTWNWAQPSDKARIIVEIKSILTHVTEAPLLDLYTSEIAQRIQVNGLWLKKALDLKLQAGMGSLPKIGYEEPRAAFVNNKKVSEAKTVPPKEEVLIINLALWSEKYFKKLMDLENEQLLTGTLLEPMLLEAIRIYRQKPEDFDKLTSALMMKFEGSPVTSFIGQHLDSRSFNFNEEQADKLFQDCQQRLQERLIRVQAKALIQELKSNNDPKKLEQFVNVMKSRSKPLDKEN